MVQVESKLVPRKENGKKPTMSGPDKWFTGQVYLDIAEQYTTDDPSNSPVISTVTFAPGARTAWHKHEKGQLIKVIAGSGWICDHGGKAKRINEGDVMWCPPGAHHWHGADDNSIMSHFVFALGKTDWYENVTDEEYSKKSD
ncbi:hypothetical protein E4T43_05609 [Aureobasidium subglaciale]|nr:hypothetical protein E4T43_05609 [Aureobasidium subglaciale]